MAQFCTRCGKPLSPEVRFCPDCGNAVAHATSPSPTQSVSSTPPQQVPQVTPVIAAAPPSAVSSGASSAASSASGSWATVAAPAAPEPAPPLTSAEPPFYPQTRASSQDENWTTVASPAAPEAPATPEAPFYSQASASASGQDWTTVATPAAPEPAPPATPAEAPFYPQTSASSQNQGWTTIPSTSAASTSATGYAPVAVSNGPAPSFDAQWTQPVASPPFSAAAPPRRRSIWPKLIGAVLVVILLVGIAVIGGIVYVGYKVQQKTRSVTQDLSHLAGDKDLNDLAKGGSPDAKGLLERLFSALAARAGKDGIPVLSSADPITPCSAMPFPVQTRARVPFKPGTMITTAWGIKYGDVESTNTIDSVNGSAVATTNRTGAYKDDNGRMSHKLTITNKNCNSDYIAAGDYMTVNAPRLPMLVHGLTRFRLSDRMFQEIKSNGQTNFTYVDVYNVPGGVKLTHQGGLLTRVEAQDVKYPMIVNDQRVDLPAVHLRGTMTVPNKDPRPAAQRPKQSEGELFVLDDPADPLVLNWRLKDPLYHDGNFRVEVVKINFPVAKPENVLEKQLVEQKRAVTYGIYFDFNQDTLKPESETVLKEIAETMTDNPTWKLTVEGHTDNVGGEAYNLDLSKRRAAAVKAALVSQYKIAPDRLLTGGYGASRPVATNDTLEGRARNRRVELVRE